MSGMLSAPRRSYYMKHAVSVFVAITFNKRTLCVDYRRKFVCTYDPISHVFNILTPRLRLRRIGLFGDFVDVYSNQDTC